ncbi:hypothetical protein [Mucilaginibacter sp.]|uniref:hypothetical protein n=1 Tax=Mucilaginibacter sp. TaxID=1882438 RepID=UPI0026339FAF|nr:hypothetical protein [Mucilaginibacter sp.]MDB4925319.1 hypothetical protein [Mucilaginibacter sp.]
MKTNFLNLTYFKFIETLAILTVLCLPFSTFCQAGHGSIEYLKYCNGINGLNLGADISSVPGNKLAFLDGNNKLDADSCLNFEYRDTALLKMPGNIFLNLIGIRTYKNKIVNIYLFFPRSEAYKLLYNFLVCYGNFTERPYAYKDVYKWNSSLVSLSLLYEAKVDFGVAIFTCNEIKNQILIMQMKAISKSIYNNILVYPYLNNTFIMDKSAMNN